MAISIANVIAAGSNTDAASYNTASVTPVANRLYLLSVAATSSGASPQPTVTGASMTWTAVDTAVSSNGRNRVSVFRAVAATPAPGALTIAFGGNTQNRCVWSLNYVLGVDVSETNGANAIVQTDDGVQESGTSIATNLSAFQSLDNAVFGAVGTNTAAVTPEAGYTELNDTKLDESGNLLTIETSWKLGQDTTPTWTISSGLGYAVSMELKSDEGVVINIL